MLQRAIIDVPKQRNQLSRSIRTVVSRLASAGVLALCVSAATGPALRVRLVETLEASTVGGAQGRSEPPPEVYTRDADDHITVRAVRLREPLVIDGRLDEEVYRRVPHLGPLIQQEPDEGAPASEATDVWIFFDDRNLYVSVRCWDSQADRIVANELRRDHLNIFQNDNFGFSLDTFHDQRSGFFFNTNAIGALRDLEIIDERGATSTGTASGTSGRAGSRRGGTRNSRFPSRRCVTAARAPRRGDSSFDASSVGKNENAVPHAHPAIVWIGRHLQVVIGGNARRTGGP